MDALGQQSDAAAFRNERLQPVQQRAGVIRPGAIARLEHKAERQAEAIGRPAEQNEGEVGGVIGLIEGQVGMLRRQDSE